MVLTNRGTAPMQIQTEFADSTDAKEIGKISAAYVIDPNGRTQIPGPA